VRLSAFASLRLNKQLSGKTHPANRLLLSHMGIYNDETFQTAILFNSLSVEPLHLYAVTPF
jgi:hypothetical protein